MDAVRTWGGRYFGWIEEGGLFARDGRHVGEFRKEIVFGENGHYLCELPGATNSVCDRAHRRGWRPA